MISKRDLLFSFMRLYLLLEDDADPRFTYTIAELSLQVDFLDAVFGYSRESEHTSRKGYFHGFNAAVDAMSREYDRRHFISFLDNELRAWLYEHNPEGNEKQPPHITPWKDIRKDALERDDHICVYCGDKATHVDHLVPVSRGGSYRMRNLAASCNECNITKSTQTALEFLGVANEDYIAGERSNSKYICNAREQGTFPLLVPVWLR